MRPIDNAWMILKDEDATAKKAIIDCLKREGGAASLDDCAKACGLSNSKCKKLIASMDNVKIHKHGDAIADGWIVMQPFDQAWALLKQLPNYIVPIGKLGERNIAMLHGRPMYTSTGTAKDSEGNTKNPDNFMTLQV